jgi:hypothetical protein
MLLSCCCARPMPAEVLATGSSGFGCSASLLVLPTFCAQRRHWVERPSHLGSQAGETEMVSRHILQVDMLVLSKECSLIIITCVVFVGKAEAYRRLRMCTISIHSRAVISSKVDGSLLWKRRIRILW